MEKFSESGRKKFRGGRRNRLVTHSRNSEEKKNNVRREALERKV
jgi:hypothetical protein